MRRILKKLIIICVVITLFSFDGVQEHQCNATWYKTAKYPIVHREHSTAAVSDYLISKMGLKVGVRYYNKKLGKYVTKRGTRLIVTNLNNHKKDTIEVTDRCEAGPKHIDLCLRSFVKISKKSVGKIPVTIKKI